MATLTTAQQRKVDLLRTSVRLQSPDTETDSAYVFTDDQLWDILQLQAPMHNVRYTADSIPDAELYFMILLSKKEIFYMLAASTAPFYPLSAEGAELQKNVRFDHYMALIKAIEESYKTAKDELTSLGEVKSYDVMLPGRHYYSLRDYNQVDRPEITLTVGKTTETSVELDWTKWDTTRGQLFHSYRLYISTAPIIDPYREYPLLPEQVAHFITYDIHRLKYRIEGLQPGTSYYVTAAVYDRNGLYGWSEQPFTTVAPVAPGQGG